MSLELTFTRRFCMAHRLTSGASAKCATPHGHNELVTVTLVPTRPERLDGVGNMVVEFGAAKRRWHAFVDDHLDHGLQLGEDDPLLAFATEAFPGWRLVVTPGDPTTELLAVLLMAKCQSFLDDEGLPLRCARVKLEETPTNAVLFTGTPAEVLPRREGWWSRADGSTS